MKHRPTILLVEDEAAFRHVYRDLLEHAGYAVIEAENGEVGWEAANRQAVDLMLLDIVMPKLNGFDLLERLRAEPKFSELPVMLMSVLGEPGDMDTGISLGADDYVVKGSVSTTELLRKVAQFAPLSKAVPRKSKAKSAAKTGKIVRAAS